MKKNLPSQPDSRTSSYGIRWWLQKETTVRIHRSGYGRHNRKNHSMSQSRSSRIWFRHLSRDMNRGTEGMAGLGLV